MLNCGNVGNVALCNAWIMNLKSIGPAAVAAAGLWQLAQYSSLLVREPCSVSGLWQSLHLATSTIARRAVAVASVIAKTLLTELTDTWSADDHVPLSSRSMYGAAWTDARPEPVAPAGMAFTTPAVVLFAGAENVPSVAKLLVTTLALSTPADTNVTLSGCPEVLVLSFVPPRLL